MKRRNGIAHHGRLCQEKTAGASPMQSEMNLSRLGFFKPVKTGINGRLMLCAIERISRRMVRTAGRAAMTRPDRLRWTTEIPSTPGWHRWGNGDEVVSFMFRLHSSS